MAPTGAGSNAQFAIYSNSFNPANLHLIIWQIQELVMLEQCIYLSGYIASVPPLQLLYLIWGTWLLVNNNC
jgi:hypothetical protein